MLAEAPREPTRAEKLKITREIDDNWDEKRQRYSGAATDHMIAEKLNVPRKWVEDIRADTFGDDGRSNEEFDKLSADILAMNAKVDTYMEKALDAAAKLEGLKSQIAGLERRLTKLTER